MTWSIIARNPATGELAIIVATKFFAVGSRVPHVRAGCGAVATQALLNPYYGVNGLLLLADGKTPAQVVAEVTAGDSGRDHRQLHIMDPDGNVAAHTGSACVDWCGHLEGEDFSIAGNMLAGPQVLEATAAIYIKSAALPFPRRLIAAMRAGEAAGGDKRGRQSAALTIHGREQWSDLDLRVDDHADPLAELERLEAVSRERWVHFRQFLPNHANPAGATDRAVIDAGIARALAAET
jgi:uncharacterized Ntn-hydrolase superfamily protein